MSESIETADNEVVTMSDPAIERVAQLIFEENDLNLKLRVYITGGGCAGFQYGFAFESKSEPDDSKFSFKVQTKEDKEKWPETVSVIVDPLSLPYLQGATIDYEETLRGSFFAVKNPNAQATCSCGSSFSLE